MTGVSTNAAIFLLVEDDPTNRSLVRAVLSRAPNARVREASLTEAGTLAAARLALASLRPDVILLDIRLPDGSGLDLARDVAKMPSAGRPKIVVMSASVLPVERDAALDAGGDVFMPKPFRPAELVELLDEWVGAAETTDAR
jgi:two-component system KDP operon response regulator KdpE